MNNMQNALSLSAFAEEQREPEDKTPLSANISTPIRETGQTSMNLRKSLSHTSSNYQVLNAAKYLSVNDPSARKSAVLFLEYALWDDMDITPALTSLEVLLNDKDEALKDLAGSILSDYALLRYGIDISQQLMHIEQNTSLPTDLLIPHIPKLQDEYLPSTQICGLITYEFKAAPLVPEDSDRIISFIPNGLLSVIATDLCKPPDSCSIDIPLISSDRRYKHRWNIRNSVVINTFVLLASLLVFALMPANVSTNINTHPDTDIIRYAVSYSPEHINAQNPSLELPDKREQLLSEPLFLQKVNRHTQRYIDAESSVFSMIEEAGRENRDFIEWFNALNDERQRGFILFVRAKALSGSLGEMVIFNKEQWLSGISDKIKELTSEYLHRNGFENVMREFSEICMIAEDQRTIFLGNNTWLRPFLDENYADFKTGLFYFFAEHQFNDEDISRKSLMFAELKEKLSGISLPIISARGTNKRISPKLTVPDAQIKEIVAASVFTELFYGIPADFITLISAYESNFSMEYWKGGYGTTQQTIKSANTVLQSKFWIDSVYASSGVKVRMQMVPLSALDNVFLCITEAGKTIAVKAAELNIRTSDIATSRTVLFDGHLMPASWAIAYKYNGSQRNARSYADNIHSYFSKKKNWLGSFHSS